MIRNLKTALGIFLMIGVFFVTGCGQSKKANQTKDISNAKTIHSLMVKYDTDFGEYPESFEKLVEHAKLSQEEIDKMQPLSGNWIIHSGSVASPQENVVLSYNQAVDGQRLIVKNNGSAMFVSEEEYQSKINNPEGWPQ